jgi:hypothetical protein
MSGKLAGLRRGWRFEELTAKEAGSGSAWLRALCRLPSFKLTGVYALPLQIFASVFAASNVAFLARMLTSPWLALCLATIVALSVLMLLHWRLISSGGRLRYSTLH